MNRTSTLVWSLLTTLVLGCGGGESDTTAADPFDSSGRTILAATSETSDPTVVELIKVSETRINRTTFEYAFQIQVQNGSTPLMDVKATLIGVGAGTTIVQGAVDVGTLAAFGLVVPAGTLTVRQDRTFAFDQSALQWSISGSPSIAASGTIGAAGGTLELPDIAKLEVPPGALSVDTKVTLSQAQGDSEDDRFWNGMDGIAVSDAASFAVMVDVDRAEWTSDLATLRILVSADMAANLAADSRLVVFSGGRDESDDDTKPESLEYSEALESTFDIATRTLSVLLPRAAFKSELSNTPSGVAAVLRVAAVTLDDVDSAAGASSGVSRLSVRPSATPPAALQCAGDASFEAPLQYGSRNGISSALEWYVPYAAILGPFSEPRQAKKKDHTLIFLPNGQPDMSNGHVGMDFSADLQTPVLAVGNGFVQQVKNENWTCATKKTPVKKTGAKADPGYSVTLAVTNAAGAVTDRVVYRHLKLDGLQIPGLRDLADSKTCWKEKASVNNRAKAQYKVVAKVELAKSGDSGTCIGPSCVKKPHMHFEWYPAFVSASTVPQNTRNALCKLATIYPGRIDSSYSSPDVAEMGGRLYARPAKGTVDFYGDPDTLTEFLVRRNKLDPNRPSNPCLVNYDQGPCDVGIRGWFSLPMIYPANGYSWPAESDGDMGRPAFLTTTRGVLDISLTFALTPFERELTPPPPIFAVQPIYTFDQSVPCAPTGHYSFSVRVFWDHLRKEVRTFALSEQADVSFPPQGASCGLVISRSPPGG